MEVYLYFGIAFVFWAIDAMVCVAAKRKFKILGSFIACLAWPISMPMVIIASAYVTKDYKSGTEQTTALNNEG